MMVQTSRPSNPVIQALQRGEPIGLLDDMIEERRLDGLPPFGELAVLDVTDAPSWMAEQLGQMQASVLGPLEHDGQQRWLIQDRSLREDKHILRKIVQDARDAGARVRVDVDPIDL